MSAGRVCGGRRPPLHKFGSSFPAFFNCLSTLRLSVSAVNNLRHATYREPLTISAGILMSGNENKRSQAEHRFYPLLLNHKLGRIARTLFMSTLTKEQTERLTPEQQKDLALIEGRRVEKRERLLRQARRSNVHLFVEGAGLAAILGLAGYYRLPIPLLFCIGGLAAVVCIEIISSHRRMDALLELLEADDQAA